MTDVVAAVDQRLPDQRALPRDLRTAEPADQLLALAAEHRPAHDLDPSACMGLRSDHASTLTRPPDVDVRLPLLEAEAAVEAVRGLPLLARRQLDRDRARVCGLVQGLTRESLSDAAAAGRLVHHHVVDPRPHPRRDAVDDQGEHPEHVVATSSTSSTMPAGSRFGESCGTSRATAAASASLASVTRSTFIPPRPPRACARERQPRGTTAHTSRGSC